MSSRKLLKELEREFRWCEECETRYAAMSKGDVLALALMHLGHADPRYKAK